ncbi:MAG TPA: UDP-2,3-diacylglucosamine diphosphatase [Gemmatimonadales bacterium]|nr:UDP-2,3-diacylglucosamine diphosphatase [Gemmatimonadales bacterium]
MSEPLFAPPAGSHPGTGATAERVVVVGDSHLGAADPGDQSAFHDFLAALPGFTRRLVITGDLFDFWFEYKFVIPRRPFGTLARLAALIQQGVSVEAFGGNHDRWGGSFWRRDLGIPFHREGAELELAGRRAWVIHGDGLTETKLGGRIIHRVTRHPITVGVFRALHPDIGFWLADRLSGGLAEANRTEAAMDRAAAAQERYARALLDRRPELALVVMAHTHRARLVEHAPGRFYLNAGQWVRDRAYAVIDPDGIRLMRWPEKP